MWVFTVGAERLSVFLMEGLGASVRNEGWPLRLTSLRRTSSRTDEGLKVSQDTRQVGVTASKVQFSEDRMCVRSGFMCAVRLYMLVEQTYTLLCIWYKVQSWLVGTNENGSEGWGSVSGQVSGQQVQAHCEDGGGDFLELFADMIMCKDVQNDCRWWLQPWN